MKARRGRAESSRNSPRALGTPSVVIVHGAWVDAAAWRDVIALLQATGVCVIAAQNPLSSLADDVDAVTRAIIHQRQPIVLVGHDYGGTVITQAGNHSSVEALVYVAAYAPDSGESTADVQKGYAPSSCVARFEVDSGGFLYLDQDAVPELLAQDVPIVENRVLAAAQKPIRASALLDCVETAAWRRKPSWYVVTDEDRMMPPLLQRAIASRIHAKVCVLRAGHAPFLSKPRETADVVLAAVDFVRENRRSGASIAASGDRE